jgi:GxxExxY protein
VQFDTPLVRQVIGCAIEVHSILGPGLLESAYERCLAHEFRREKIAFRRQLVVPVVYKGLDLECAYRVDFDVEDGPLIEIKTVRHLAPVHTAQVITYLKLLHRRHALLINFNEAVLKHGLRSIVL